MGPRRSGAPATVNAGHFGLATHDYTNSTAPNRRYADLVTQRLVLAVLAGTPVPYTNDELTRIAQHGTEREDAARKVERQVRKLAAAVSMASHVGDRVRVTLRSTDPTRGFVDFAVAKQDARVRPAHRQC